MAGVWGGEKKSIKIKIIIIINSYARQPNTDACCTGGSPFVSIAYFMYRRNLEVSSREYSEEQRREEPYKTKTSFLVPAAKPGEITSFPFYSQTLLQVLPQEGTAY